MLSTITSVLLTFIAGIALMSALTFAMSAALLWRFQVVFYARGLRHCLSAMRQRQYNDRGLAPRKRRLRQQTHEEALQLISGGTLISPATLPRWTLEFGRRVEHAFEHADVLPDVLDKSRSRLRAELIRERRASKANGGFCSSAPASRPGSP